MESTANPQMSIPSFKSYVDGRRYLRNVSSKTLSWFTNAWKAFGPHNEPVLVRLAEGLRTASAKLLAKGCTPSLHQQLPDMREGLRELASRGGVPTREAKSALAEVWTNGDHHVYARTG